ncbi:MAG: recombinase family protein [Firmicutes bacterium]|nr:recombinase family protein [Bacillota bacterium]
MNDNHYNNHNVTAALYIRWSTDDQGTGTTLDVQRDGCLKWAGDRGLTVDPAFIFVDEGVSGAKEHRPALDRMNRLIQQGTVNLVIVYKLDRLARSQYVMFKLVEKDWHKKASIASVMEAAIDTTTTHGRAAFGMSALFASTERDMIRDRTLSGKRKRASEGRNPGLRPSYGYDVVDKRFVILEHEATLVRRIFDEYVNNGRTGGQIARLLNDSGIRTKKGGPWHISAVQRVLKNPGYKGTLIYRDIIAEHAFPIIVEPSIWAQAQGVRNQKAKLHPRRLAADSPYILSGRLTCAKCGRPMNGRVSRNGKAANRYYACAGYSQFRDCDCLTVRQDKLEDAVVRSLLPLLDEAELGRRIAARTGVALALLGQEVTGMEARKRELAQELTRVRQDYRRAKIDADTFNALRTAIEADQGTVERSLAGKKTNLLVAQTDAKVGDEVRQAVNLLRAWEGLSYAQRKQVIHLLTERIVWDYHAQQLTVQSAV